MWQELYENVISLYTWLVQYLSHNHLLGKQMALKFIVDIGIGLAALYLRCGSVSSMLNLFLKYFWTILLLCWFFCAVRRFFLLFWWVLPSVRGGCCCVHLLSAGVCCCLQLLWCGSARVGVLGGWVWCGSMRRGSLFLSSCLSGSFLGLCIPFIGHLL